MQNFPKVGFCLHGRNKNLRKARILKYPPVINYRLLHRLHHKTDTPKIHVNKGIYFFLTRGQIVLSPVPKFWADFTRVASKWLTNNLSTTICTLSAARLSTGLRFGGHLWTLVKLRRIGKGGKEIKVYKMRTMHPYAEYLQEYIYQKHSLDEGGKFKDDFRVSTLGRIMRRLWIDELPMLINLFRGELKIVGVRPLSKQYFSLYTTELQEKRIKTKPGLIPPFYVDKPETLEGIMASEHKYLDAYFKHPFLTDFKYFFKAVYNIVVKRYRSR